MPRSTRVAPALAVLVLAVALLPGRSPVVSALTGEPLPGVRLEHPWAYLALAPAYGIMDFLTSLTVDQHVMVFIAIGGFYLIWRVARRRTERSPLGRVLVEGGTLVAFVLGLAAFYGAGVLAYRPMARLVVDDPDVVVVDFHSHTRASHDGRWDFTTERNRQWHRGAGFHVAYIADHDSVAPALRALEHNPARAGDDTVLLPGREVVYAGQHVAVLGVVDPREGAGTWKADPEAPPAPHAVAGASAAERGADEAPADRQAVLDARAMAEDDALAEAVASALPGADTGFADPAGGAPPAGDDDGDPAGALPARWCAGWPVLIQTIPNDLSRVPVPACTEDGAGVEAIELLDGDPRGLAQADREWDHIVRLADSLDVALVAASNLHGWGSTSVSWNLMRIPGWRDMAPEEVGRRIEDMIRYERRAAVEVVAYRRPPPQREGRFAAVGASVALPIHFVAMRTRPERFAWLGWAGALALGTGWLRRRRDAA